MATVVGRDASIYWGTGTPALVIETRNIVLDMGSDFIDDTVHGDVNRSFQPSFANFGCKVTGLFDTGGTSKTVITDALAKASGKFSVYIGGTGRYLYGCGYVSVDEIGQPYDDFDTFNWSCRASGAVGNYFAA